jgi:hypothetical protein
MDPQEELWEAKEELVSESLSNRNSSSQLFGGEFGLPEAQAKLNHWRAVRAAMFDENQQPFPGG